MSTNVSADKKWFLNLLKAGLNGLSLYWIPFVLIQAAAIVLVVLYYNWASVAVVCDRVAEWKSQGGLWASVWTTSLACGLVPEVVKALTGRGTFFNRDKWYDLVFLCTFFAVVGVCIHVFYYLQTFLFGAGTDFYSVLRKVMLDQCFYSPFIACTLCVAVFHWRDEGFDLKRSMGSMSWRLFVNRFAQIEIPNLIYWVPMTACIYSLPVPLQFPLFLCASSAWALLLVFILESYEDRLPQEMEGLPLRPVRGSE